MSMTREEAILLSAYTGFLLVPDFSDVHKFCEDTLGRPILTHEFGDQDVQKEIQDKLRSQIMELIQNIAALRPITREQVEKVFPGCLACKDGVLKLHIPAFRAMAICNQHMDHEAFDIELNGQFCLNCGRPLTDEAVQMVMERWEAMKDGSCD